jgi:hypothetical protein
MLIEYLNLNFSKEEEEISQFETNTNVLLEFFNSIYNRKR